MSGTYLEKPGDCDLVKRVLGWSSMDLFDRYGQIGNRAVTAFNTIKAQLANGLRSMR